MHYYLCLLLIFFALKTAVLAQTEADWIDLEITQKQRALILFRKQNERRLRSNSANYDVTYYGLRLNLDIRHQLLIGDVVIKARALENYLESCQLDLDNNLQINGVSGWVSSYNHTDNILQITFPQPVRQGDTFSVRIIYQGTPISGGFQGFTFEYHNDQPIVSSLSEPYYASSWFPCKDRPNDKADSADIAIRVPINLTAVSNGYLREVIEHGDGTHTFCWSERYPIAVYLISIAVSNYVHWSDSYLALDKTIMPVDYWVYPEYESVARPVLAQTPQMIRHFVQLWGEYPFVQEKYGQAQFSWIGGMEHQTCTSLGSFSEMMTCHELAHSWWGNMVTCADWKNIWLNEGFARYAEALWKESDGGASSLKAYMNDLNVSSQWQPGSVYIWDTTRVSTIFNRIVYDKGAWILHMLRKIVGEDNFAQIFATYRQRFAYKNVVTADFQRVCEEVSGMSLEWFFKQWVFGSGQPYYKVEWRKQQRQDGSWSVGLALSQIQTSGTYFKMPLEIKVRTAAGDTTFCIWDSLKTQQFEMQCYQQPESVWLDPNSWVLKKVSYCFIDDEINPLPQQFQISLPYPNPFNSMIRFVISLPYSVAGRLSVIDFAGREVALLEQGVFPAGKHFQAWQPHQCSSGIYFIKFTTDRNTTYRKVVYLK